MALRNGNYDKAIGHFFQALKMAETSRDTFGIMEAHYSISWAHLDQNHYDQALRYLQTAEQFNKRLPFSNISLNIYNHFGVIYRQTGEFDKAKGYLKKGISLSKAPEYQGLNITMINNLASVYAKEGFKQKAIALQEEALIRSREINNYLRELQTLYGLARTYGSDNPSKAIFYLRQAALLAREKKAYKQEMRYLREITELYKTQGNYREALMTKEREHALADSFFYKDMSQHIEALKAEYDLSKSKARINELSYINNKNRLELEKSTLVRNVTVASFILLLGILGLVYNQYRIKQRANKAIGEKNHSLELLVEEKEWLLKEIHHRVKNNLQIITSLLHSQGVYLKDHAALSAIRESQNRVHAMALIHQKLYQSDRLASVAMAEYIEEIVDYLINSFDSKGSVQAQLAVAPVNLDVIQAVLVGLILNEAVTNSLKYAFPHNQRGTISINLAVLNAQKYWLQIRDDGIGLPADFNPSRSRTLGMSLIRGLSKQLGGDLQITSESGLQVSLFFTEEKVIKPRSKTTY
ncbi:histidine kinase dimerization/phosphoacceptor domain -containing protein [Spirosoma sp. KNUC1025]|uniref:tetratricopeptide repeat-containing sensor histidine kinase n=1 Tax=Spirosoma sp. KNUC1025 TaxID=2894082 RepID=UPI0038651B08|nr:tetratricopeptide repeat protein [Spirosoma sp. KNUC1025]